MCMTTRDGVHPCVSVCVWTSSLFFCVCLRLRRKEKGGAILFLHCLGITRLLWWLVRSEAGPRLEGVMGGRRRKDRLQYQKKLWIIVASVANVGPHMSWFVNGQLQRVMSASLARWWVIGQQRRHPPRVRVPDWAPQQTSAAAWAQTRAVPPAHPVHHKWQSYTTKDPSNYHPPFHPCDLFWLVLRVLLIKSWSRSKQTRSPELDPGSFVCL